VGPTTIDSGAVFLTKAGVSVGTDVIVGVEEGMVVGVDVDGNVCVNVLVMVGVGDSAAVEVEVGGIPCRNSEGVFVDKGHA